MSNILSPRFHKPLRYQPINDAKLILRIRNWFVRLLVGNSVVIMNVEIDFVESQSGEAFVVECSNGIMVDFTLPRLGELVPRVRPKKRSGHQVKAE